MVFIFTLEEGRTGVNTIMRSSGNITRSVLEDVTRTVVREEVGREVGREIDKLRLEIDDKARGYRDDILTRFDDFAGRFESVQEDTIIATHQTKELKEQVENHERRLKRLEKAKN